MLYRNLTPEESSRLAWLNESVRSAIEARSRWLDDKMAECSALNVGDDIYDIQSGLRLGVITGLYRFWRDRDEGVRDNSFCWVTIRLTHQTKRV